MTATIAKPQSEAKTAPTVYEAAAEKAVPLLEAGKWPWLQGPAQNPVGASGEEFGGINHEILAMSGFKDPRFWTQEVAKEHNLYPKAGSKATRIFKMSTTRAVPRIDAETGERMHTARGQPLYDRVRVQHPTGYYVPTFNASQMNQIPPLENRMFMREPEERGNEILRNSGITVVNDQKNRDFYHPVLNEIHMRPAEEYQSRTQYVEKGLYHMVQAMAHDESVARRTRDFGSPEKEIRDAIGCQIAHARLCKNIGIPVDETRNLDMAKQYAAELKKNPFIYMEAANLADRVCQEVLSREMQRVPERENERELEKQALRYSSPVEEIEKLRNLQKMAAAAERRPDDVHQIPHGDDTLLAMKGSERRTSQPTQTPEIGSRFEVTDKFLAYNREGQCFGVTRTQAHSQLDDGQTSLIADSERINITRLENRDCDFPLDWRGEVNIRPAASREDGGVEYDVPLEMVEFHAVTAVRENGQEKRIGVYDDIADAEQFQEIYQNEYARQTGRERPQEKSLDNVVFFKVDFNDRAGRAIAQQLRESKHMDYYPQVKSWGTVPGGDPSIPDKHFERHDPYKRLEEIAAKQKERETSRDLPAFIKVAPGRESEAQHLGAKFSPKFDEWYVPSRVDPEPILARFEQIPPEQITQKQERADALVVPFADIERAERAGAVYDAAQGHWKPGADADRELLKEWSADNQIAVDRTLSPTDEFKQSLEYIGIDMSKVEIKANGETMAAPVKGDIDNQLNAVVVMLPDHSGYGKNTLSGEELHFVPKGYILSPEERQERVALAESLLNNTQRRESEANAKTADKLLERFANREYAQKPTPVMEKLGITPTAGIYANKDQTLLPMRGADGSFKSLVTIDADGNAKTQAKSNPLGAFVPIGGYDKLAASPAIIIAKGFESACAINAATDNAVAAAMDDHNIVAATKALHTAFPDKPMIIAGGDMPENIAREAAKVSDGIVVSPKLTQEELSQGKSSFHDLASGRKAGKEVVARQVEPKIKERVIRKQEETQERKRAAQKEKGGKKR